jgi:hypothetical protein
VNAWDGHAIIYENNVLLAESQRFSDAEEMIVSDLDLERLAQDRMRSTSFNDAVADHRDRIRAVRRIPFDFQIPRAQITLTRSIERFPFVPSDRQQRDERCFEAYNIQVHGLMKHSLTDFCLILHDELGVDLFVDLARWVIGDIENLTAMVAFVSFSLVDTGKG